MKPRTDATGVCQSCVCGTQTPGGGGQVLVVRVLVVRVVVARVAMEVVVGGADNGAVR